MAKIAALLSEGNITIFANSTFNTGNILVKKERKIDVLGKLQRAGGYKN